MTITSQKIFVGFLGMALCASVATVGYVDASRRHKAVAEATAEATALNPDLQKGAEIYQKNSCFACHGAAGNHPVDNFNAQTAQKVPPLIHVAESYTKDDLAKKIWDGVLIEPKFDPNGPTPPLHMPSYKGIISPDDMTLLVNYLFSLKPKDTENLGF
jgi:mono/diheme cytochrome c family protein